MRSEKKAKKIDVHKAREKYEALLAKFLEDEEVCSENRELVQRFLRDCALGKTIRNRQKKKIYAKRLLKYLIWLRKISFWLGNRDFREVSQEDMEDFICRLEADALTFPEDGEERERSYSAWTQRDVKLIVRKFYKWLLGEGKRFPELVAWIDTSIDPDPPESLHLDEIRKCVDSATQLKGKALLWALFETGARAEEFLNVRVGHVEDKDSHLVVRIDYPKTYKRSLPVFEGSEHLRQWLEEHPTGNPQDQLFPMKYGALRMFIKRVANRALDKHATPQLFRDSFATWLATKRVGRYQMCKLMGWAMSSKMPDRCINRLGVVEEEAIQAIRGDELTSVERENKQLKGALARLEAQVAGLRERESKTQGRDELLTALLEDKQLLKRMAAVVHSKGLGEMVESV